MPGRVSLFITCSSDLLYPSAAKAAVLVLEKVGYTVDFPEDQTCCGQPFLNSGDLSGARSQALHFAETFRDTEVVVTCSASCADTVRNRYPTLFPEGSGESALVRGVAARTFEFAEFISRAKAFPTLPAHPAPVRTTYHSSCRTLRGLGLSGAVEGYLEQMLGDLFVPLPEAETCCGFGGSFSVKLPEISAHMMKAKLAAIESTGAARVVSLDLGCLTHLSCGAAKGGPDGVEFLHLSEVIAEALGLGGKP